jgi:hypothetical protein
VIAGMTTLLTVVAMLINSPLLIAAIDDGAIVDHRRDDT